MNDELYRLHPALPLESTLYELQEIGNSIEGNIAVVLCGSSMMLPTLISRNTSDLDVPNIRLAESSFRCLCHWRLCVQFFQLQAPPLCRAAMFFAGANVRELGKFQSGAFMREPQQRERKHRSIASFLIHHLESISQKKQETVASD